MQTSRLRDTIHSHLLIHDCPHLRNYPQLTRTASARLNRCRHARQGIKLNLPNGIKNKHRQHQNDPLNAKDAIQVAALFRTQRQTPSSVDRYSLPPASLTRSRSPYEDCSAVNPWLNDSHPRVPRSFHPRSASSLPHPSQIFAKWVTAVLQG